MFNTEHPQTTIGADEFAMIRYKPTTNRPRRWAVFFLWIICCITACGEDPSPHVGSRDCDVLDEVIPNEWCSTCQGLACDTPECFFFPCVDGALVVEGCNADATCAHLSSENQTIYCGMFTSPHSGLCGTIMGGR